MRERIKGQKGLERTDSWAYLLRMAQPLYRKGSLRNLSPWLLAFWFCVSALLLAQVWMNRAAMSPEGLFCGAALWGALAGANAMAWGLRRHLRD